MSSQVAGHLPMSHEPIHLSPYERLVLMVALLGMFVKILASCITDLSKSKDFTPKTIRRSIVKNMGHNASSLTLRQVRSFMKPTGVVLSGLCKAEDLQHEVVPLKIDGYPPVCLHYIDCHADVTGKILLYFHGGGYVYPMTAGDFKLGRAAAHATESKLAMLEYTLAPQLKYPGQLNQAAAALQHLLRRHDPSDIVVGGSSAGGNMTLALLAHLNSPNPRVEPVSMSGILRGAFCVSPRCSNITTSASYKYNAAKDIVGVSSMQLFTANWQPVVDEVWATPIKGDEAFWSSIHARKLLLTAGADEVYVDDIKRLGEIMHASEDPRASVQIVVCPREIHVQAVMDVSLGTEDGIILTPSWRGCKVFSR